jgi:hypothetical protein
MKKQQSGCGLGSVKGFSTATLVFVNVVVIAADDLWREKCLK